MPTLLLNSKKQAPAELFKKLVKPASLW